MLERKIKRIVGDYITLSDLALFFSFNKEFTNRCKVLSSKKLSVHRYQATIQVHKEKHNI